MAPMAKYYDIDGANARLPEVREILELLRTQRAELVRLRDRLVQVAAGGVPAAGQQPDDSSNDLDSILERTPQATPPADEPPSEAEEVAPGDAQLIRLRIRGLVDQMGASVLRLDEWGITLRDIETGLIDFPALVNGRQVWLCWRLGEERVDWWHELDAGFGGRHRLIDLV
jgi:hypothetical protein